MQSELISMFEKLARDDTPIVRRFSAKNVAAFAAVVDDKVLLEKLMPIFQGLVTDDQATVKTPAIESMHLIMKRITPKQANESLRTIYIACTEDRLWKIRAATAGNFGDCVQYFPPEVIHKEILPTFIALLSDSEHQVRAAIVKHVDLMYSLIPEADYDTKVVPLLKTLVDDSNTTVRANLSAAIMNLLPKLKGKLADKVLKLVTEHLLQDEFAECRLNVSNGGEVPPAAGCLFIYLPLFVASHSIYCTIHQVLLNMSNFFNLSKEAIHATLLPAIKSVKNDKHWRIRRAVLEGIPNLAKNISQDEFSTHFLDLYMTALEDPVNAVRMCCGSCLQHLCKIYGEKWTVAHFIPKINNMWDHAVGYQQKVTVLYSIQCIASEFTDANVFKELVTRVIKGMLDDTPNVQFIAIQTMIKILPHVDTKYVVFS
jgi:serine/threonine-protein phosphatase 2A regulatory subunit A